MRKTMEEKKHKKILDESRKRKNKKVYKKKKVALPNGTIKACSACATFLVTF